MQRNKTSYDLGLEKGREGRDEARNEARNEARRTGHIELLEALLESRFGALSETSLAKLRAIPDEQLRPLALALHSAATIADLGL